MRVALATHGCRLNQSETDAIEAALLASGHEIAAGPEDAEVFVLNSCTITHQADADARKQVRRAKRSNPNVQVVVTGCYANADPEGVAALPGVDAVVGNGEKAGLAALLHTFSRPASGTAGSTLIQVRSLARAKTMVPLQAARPRTRTRALLKVQDGCNYRCSFCIVPSVRGGSRSSTIEQVVTQLKRLVDAGAPEIVLTGIHFGTYGRDLRPRVRLAELVAQLLPHLAGARLRLSSLDPHEVDDALIDLMAENTPQICRHLHLPVQSGDPGILRAMRRGHSAADFVTLTQKLAERVPGICIGTDVIVGFPGESAQAFEATLHLLRDLPVAYHHVFTYSKRAGTSAAEMQEQVPEHVKARRNQALRELSNAQQQAFGHGQAGEVADVVVERPRRGVSFGLTDNYVKVRLDSAEPAEPADPAEPGQRLSLRLAVQDDEVIARR